MRPEIEQYQKEGYSIFRKVLDEELIAEVSAHVEWLQRRYSHLRPEHLGHTLVRNDPFWVRLVSDRRLLDIAELFVGPDIALFASHSIGKPPSEGQPVLWRQDGSCWPLEPMEVVTLWLAVDDSTPENGCMRVLPGTHRMALQPLRRRVDIPNVLGSGVDESLVDESRAVDAVLQAGDVSVRRPALIHGSNANRSTKRRCGLTIRYIPTTTRITVAHWPSAFLLRRKSVPGVNDYLPCPRSVEGEHLPFRGCEAWR